MIEALQQEPDAGSLVQLSSGGPRPRIVGLSADACQRVAAGANRTHTRARAI